MPKQLNEDKKARDELKDSTEEFEGALRAQAKEKYILRLYVSGTTPKSMRAIENIKRICHEYLDGRYDLEVIDVYQDPESIREAEIMAVPTLIKKLPSPLRRLIGDLSSDEKILVGLDLHPTEVK